MTSPPGPPGRSPCLCPARCYRRLLPFVGYGALLLAVAIATHVMYVFLTSSHNVAPADADRSRQGVRLSQPASAQFRARPGSTELSGRTDSFLARMETECSNVTRQPSAADVPLCPCVPTGLTGRLWLTLHQVDLSEVEARYPSVQRGGSWRPGTCQPRRRTCVLVPYRGRPHQVAPFMDFMHGFLQRQAQDYTIYLVEQNRGAPFNRGLLLNVGSLVVQSARPSCHCLVLHDIDMFPEDDRNLYACADGAARHLAAARKHFQYRLPYAGYFGGITAVGALDFERANGFSNMYSGWGSEDDDLLHRLFGTGLTLMRYPLNISRVTMTSHPTQPPNPRRLATYLGWRERWPRDGLNSVHQVATISRVQQRPLYTYVGVITKGSDVTERRR